MSATQSLNTVLRSGNYEQEMASVFDKRITLPDDTVVLPGHMQETRIGQERQTNPSVPEELQRRKA